MTRLLDRPDEPGTAVADRTAVRRRDALLARLRGGSLDRRLAAGEPPEADRLLTVRAALLVDPRFRAKVAQGWADLAARARHATTYQVPIARRRVLAAGPELDTLVTILRGGRPVSARGTAMAWLLLTNADSPVFALRCSGDVAAALTDVLTTL